MESKNASVGFFHLVKMQQRATLWPFVVHLNLGDP